MPGFSEYARVCMGGVCVQGSLLEVLGDHVLSGWYARQEPPVMFLQSPGAWIELVKRFAIRFPCHQPNKRTGFLSLSLSAGVWATPRSAQKRSPVQFLGVTSTIAEGESGIEPGSPACKACTSALCRSGFFGQQVDSFSFCCLQANSGHSSGYSQLCAQ